MLVTEDLKRELTAKIMDDLSVEFSGVLTSKQHLRISKIIYEHIHKTFSFTIWNVIGECLKANQPWTERESYHCNCKDKLDPRPCVDHGRKK